WREELTSPASESLVLGYFRENEGRSRQCVRGFRRIELRFREAKTFERPVEDIDPKWRKAVARLAELLRSEFSEQLQLFGGDVKVGDETLLCARPALGGFLREFVYGWLTGFANFAQTERGFVDIEIGDMARSDVSEIRKPIDQEPALPFDP